MEKQGYRIKTVAEMFELSGPKVLNLIYSGRLSQDRGEIIVFEGKKNMYRITDAGIRQLRNGCPVKR